ncbi:hypothetical protein QMZ92_03245 [Streptomyces sp. HNM0645]|uniref:hypothetical protein n=1 Tax=Streptomyces sp. HNM0645 TaxID=2782343 RepID=UPI0024B86F12|nr:hypothetical protein [Streptomyces sp. HNM0645]MDI9883441.1 hypothetical protein [Streptomyces sp. HNM0645]
MSPSVRWATSSEARSAVDEAFRRWYALSRPARSRITAPRSWLVRVTDAVCLDRPALPGREPAPAGGEHATPAEQSATRTEQEAGEVVPAGRAALVPDDAFGTAPRPTPASRDGRSRSVPNRFGVPRCGLRARRLRPATPLRHDLVVHAVRHACLTQDATLLTSLPAPDATASFDGGGKVRAPDRPVLGGRQVARSLPALLA